MNIKNTINGVIKLAFHFDESSFRKSIIDFVLSNCSRCRYLVRAFVVDCFDYLHRLIMTTKLLVGGGRLIVWCYSYSYDLCIQRF